MICSCAKYEARLRHQEQGGGRCQPPAGVPRFIPCQRFLQTLWTVAGSGVLAACRGTTSSGPPATTKPPVSLTYIYDHTDLPQTIGAWYRWIRVWNK